MCVLVARRPFLAPFPYRYVPDVLFIYVSKTNIRVTLCGIGNYSTFQWKYISAFLCAFLDEMEIIYRIGKILPMFVL
jgi:hypothetical protein